MAKIAVLLDASSTTDYLESAMIRLGLGKWQIESQPTGIPVRVMVGEVHADGYIHGPCNIRVRIASKDLVEFATKKVTVYAIGVIPRPL